MDILPIQNLTRIVEPSRHTDHESPQKRQSPRKKEKKPEPAPLYTPDGHMEQEAAAKIDVVA